MKASEVFEGKNSSLKRAFDNAVENEPSKNSMKSLCCKAQISTEGARGGFIIHCEKCGQILDIPKGYKVFDLEIEIKGEVFDFTVLAKSKEQAKKMVKIKVL